ncbi:MAG: hypothetical protein CMH83_08865 [Nocardioides sp.]|nr:hypothetical protein [Nocardioides sp.]
MRRLRSLFLLVSVMTAVVWPVAAVAPPASAATNVTIQGTVVCDGDAVQGIWVENYNGSGNTGKWASWWAYPNRSNAAYYSVTLSSTTSTPKVRLDIGCGGTRSSWRRTLLSPDFTTRTGYTENRRCIGSHTAANRARVCTPSPRGATSSTNTADRGYCTWGAKEKWKAAVGSYPNLVGNAKNWDDDARSKGFYVSSVPHRLSMVVWNTSDQYGHVGWVTKVYKKSDGKVYFDSIDMNTGSWVNQGQGTTTGFGKYQTRTGLAWNPSVQAFIVAPT